MLSELAERRQNSPHTLAFDVDGDRATWADLHQRVALTAGRFAQSGVGVGDVCGIALPTGLAAITAVYALQWLGAVPLVLDVAQPLDTTARRLQQHGASHLLIADEDTRAAAFSAAGITMHRPAELERLGSCTPVECRPNEVAFLQLTSGTSGEPRAAAVTHRNIIAELDSARDAYGIVSDDVLVSWLPLHHDFGLVLFVFGPVVFGSSAYLIQPRLTNLRPWLRTIARVGGTITAAPDFAYRAATRMFAAEDIDLDCLRLAICGGEPIRPSTLDAFEAAFSLSGVMSPAYGLAEATLGVTALDPAAPRRTDDDGNTSCGPALPALEVQIVDEDGRSVAVGGYGEVAVRGDTVFHGYWNEPDATAAVLRDGWLHTGDVGHLDADGHLYVTGRARAMIKRAGRIIPARAVEEVVDGVNGVRRSAAFGSPIGPSGTEDLIVVAEAGGTVPPNLSREIEQLVRRSIGVPPADVVIVGRNQLPHTRNGKLRHAELKRRYEADELLRRD